MQIYIPGDPGHAAATRHRWLAVAGQRHRVRGDAETAGSLRGRRRRRARRSRAARGGAGLASAAGRRFGAAGRDVAAAAGGAGRRSGRSDVRPDLDDAVVRIGAPVPIDDVVAAFVDNAAAEAAVTAAIAVIDEADLGDEDAELTVGDAQDHDLAWYATQELPFLLELL